MVAHEGGEGKGAIAEAVEASAVATKLLQIRQELATTVRWGMHFCHVFGFTPDTLYALERGTPECIMAAATASSAVTPYAGTFQHPTRCSCLDRHPSNDAAEVSIVKDRQGWDALRTDCEVHMDAHVLSLLDVYCVSRAR